MNKYKKTNTSIVIEAAKKVWEVLSGESEWKNSLWFQFRWEAVDKRMPIYNNSESCILLNDFIRMQRTRAVFTLLNIVIQFIAFGAAVNWK